MTNILFAILDGGERFVVALLSYGFAGLLGVFFFLFCTEYLFNATGERHMGRVFQVVAATAGVAVSLLSVVPGFVGRGVGAEGEIFTNFAALMLYGAILVSLIVLGLRALLIARRSGDPCVTKRTNTVLLGLALAAIVGLFFNLLLPLQGVYTYVAVGPLGSIILVVLCAYAIIRHRLFSIQLVIARALGYLLSTVFIGAIYGLLALGVTTTFFFRDEQLTSSQLLVLTVIAVGIAFTLPVLKRFFDKLTNGIFYQDAYNPQLFIERLNRSLVSFVDMRKLLTESAKLISDTFKAEFCIFAIPSPDDHSKPLIVGSIDNIPFSSADIALGQKLVNPQMTIILTDDLSTEGGKLKGLLEKNRVAALVKLSAGPQLTGGNFGYMVLGNKKSGNAYTTQDIRMFETIANGMVVALQNAYRFEEIKRFNATLQEKVNDATRQLRRKNERLRLLDQTKDDFISMASHQLRTPLTSVKGYVSMVLEGDAGKLNGLQRKLLNQSFVSAQRMVYLISDLLNVSRLRTGKFELEPVATNLATVVESEIEQLTETARARNLELLYVKPGHFPTYMLDETKLRQVIMNFVDNAIYYTPSGGKIEVVVADKPESIELTVTDTGIGVPKVDQPHMFTKYFRARNAQVARPDGTGLGLFMAKKVIIAHGGAVIFKSRERKGSTFGFSIPKTALQEPSKKTPAAATSKKTEKM